VHVINVFVYFEGTGLEKETIKGYVHRTSDAKEEVKYESSFDVPADFGEVGAILVENKPHKEMFLKDIILNGFPNGPVHVGGLSDYLNPKRVYIYIMHSSRVWGRP
jgi:hypothetical protein